jgi:protein TonB
MFATLIESAPIPGPRDWPARLASAVSHGALIAVAAAATQAPVTLADREIGETPVFVPADPVPPRPTVPSVPVTPGLPGVRLPTVLDIPMSVPLPQPTMPGQDPTVWSEPWPSAPGAPGDPGIGTPAVGAVPVDARIVEHPPALLSHPTPRYPEILRQAGIEGSVLVDAVLDTLGRVEPTSVRVVRGAHALFDAEAMAMVLGSRYRAGRMDGRAVRVRIQVPVAFALRR